jgi:hypothetical protein
VAGLDDSGTLILLYRDDKAALAPKIVRGTLKQAPFTSFQCGRVY